MIPSPPRWVDREQLKEIFGEPSSNREYEMLKAPHDQQLTYPRVACTGYVDEMALPAELSFGMMEWTPGSYGSHVRFFATGEFVSFGRDNIPAKASHQGIAARRLSKRIATSRTIDTIDTIIITRKQQ